MIIKLFHFMLDFVRFDDIMSEVFVSSFHTKEVFRDEDDISA